MPQTKKIKPDPGALGSTSLGLPECLPLLIALIIEKDLHCAMSESVFESECDSAVDRKPVLGKKTKKDEAGSS